LNFTSSKAPSLLQEPLSFLNSRTQRGRLPQI
jgi:hypothetical protein